MFTPSRIRHHPVGTFSPIRKVMKCGVKVRRVFFPLRAPGHLWPNSSENNGCHFRFYDDLIEIHGDRLIVLPITIKSL